MSNELKQVGQRIQAARKAKNITQADLADTMGIALSYMSNIECGKTNFSVEILVRLVNALGVSADWLLSPDTSYGARKAASELEELLAQCSVDDRQVVLSTARTVAEQLQARRDED